MKNFISIKDMKYCLFALTGFGNSIIDELLNFCDPKNIIVITRKEKGQFPYYDCEKLENLCKQKCVCYFTPDNLSNKQIYNAIKNFNPDIIFVASYHKKIPKNIIEIPNKGAINIHPSLLPNYRGPTPTNWAIIKGELESGVTYHYVDEKFDMGDILYQKRFSIINLNDGELRRKAALTASKIFQPFLKKFLNQEIIPIVQKKDEGNYFPHIKSKEGIDLIKSKKFNQINIAKGLTPYPGVGILN